MKKVVAALLIFVCVVISAPAIGLAQNSSSGVSQSVPIAKVGDTSFTSIMNYLKDFVLNTLATAVAKQILHQMTVSVINWINTGFKGNPSFLTHPGGFFEGVGVQVANEFLSGNGVLSKLCSPFAVNIRLSLAMQQAKLLNQQYSCTLSTVISNFKNLPNNITVNGMSINGFMNGDFSQGGWPAFIALTTEPQNNPYGAYLMAQSDMQATIAGRQQKIQTDIGIGNGFMSFPVCKDIPGGTFNADAGQANNNGQVASTLGQDFTANQNLSSSPGSFSDYQAQQSTPTNSLGSQSTQDDQIATLKQAHPDAKAVFSSNGKSVTYQDCTTETPGSVISGQINQQLGVPANELLLANNINAVISTLVSHMISTMLSPNSGLYNLSSKGGYTSQLSKANTKGIKLMTVKSFTKTVIAMQKNIDDYGQAIADIQDSRNSLESSRACFANLLAPPSTLTPSQRTVANGLIANIDTSVSTQVDPLIQTYTQSQTDAKNNLAQAQALFSSTTVDFSALPTDQNGNSDATGTQALLDQETAYVQNIQSLTDSVSSAAAGANSAAQDLATAKKQAAEFTKEAKMDAAVCKQLPNSQSNSSSPF